MSKRLLELDVLRGLAVLAVIACHYTSACRELGCMTTSFRLGSYGPHLFFVISGFVIFLTLRRTRSAKDFFVSRFSRLFPVYWLAVAVAFAAFSWFPLPGESVTLRQAVTNLTMCQTWLRVPDVDVSYWTLGVELKFYAVMLGVFLVGLHRRIDLVLGAWLAAILAYWTAVETFGLSVPHAVATPLNADYGHLFIAGIAFYLLKTDGSSVYRHAILGCCLATQAALGGMESALVVLLLFTVFYAFVYGRLEWIVCRPLVLLGTISYSLYVLHHPIGNVVMITLQQFSQSPVVLISAATVATFLVSTAATWWVEKPAMGWIRGRYAGWCKRGETGEVAGRLPLQQAT